MDSTGGRLQSVLMRPPPPLSVKTWRRGGAVGGGGGVLAVRPGGGGFLNTMQFPCFSNFSRASVAMVCHWAVQREQNKDQTHSTSFNYACGKKFGPCTTGLCARQRQTTSARQRIGIMGNYGELWGIMGNYGELWVIMGNYGELWGSMGNYGELWGNLGNYGELWGNFGELWGSMGNYGE